MKSSHRLFWVWVGILVISLLPVLFWGLSGEKNDSLSHNLGVVFGLVGMTMFALTFLFSSKMKWVEKIVNGLDKSYITHGILGSLALIVIMAHPILLVLKFVPEQINIAASYLLPGSHWSVNFGIISILTLIILIVMTLFVRMKYNHWKFSHEFLGLVFLFAVFHVFFIKTNIAQGNIFEGYYIYAAIVSFIGLFSFAHSFFYKKHISNHFKYTVKSVNNIGDFFEIVMTPEDKVMSYEAGQFIFVKFRNKKLGKESHPFSIASMSGSRDVVIVVKKLGDYTGKLSFLEKGDLALIDGPYGKFSYKKYRDSNQVWIAAGVGVTPFIGMAQDVSVDDSFEGKVNLIYTARKENEILGDNIFKDAEKKSSKFKYMPWVSSKDGRLDVKRIFEISGKFRDKEFFICGPEEFKKSIITSLLKSGVSQNRVHEEAFNFK